MENTDKKKITKKSPNKDAEAKAKVKELLKNTSVASLVEDNEPKSQNIDSEFNLNEIKKEKSMSWMEKQVHDLTEQVEMLENEILFYKSELEKNNNKSTNVIDQSVNPNIIALFKHFENVYERGYTDAKLAHPQSGNGVLDKFLEYFPELQRVRIYKYKG